MKAIALPTVERLRFADAETIRKEGITSYQLMQRAAENLSKYIQPLVFNKRVAFLCGSGNNGGDGLLLAANLFGVCNCSVVDFSLGSNPSGDRMLACSELIERTSVEIHSPETFDWNSVDVLVDAWFGFGLNRPLTGIHLDWVNRLNALGKPIFSIDLPSGMQVDGIAENALCASETFAIQVLKPSFFIRSNEQFTGKVTVVDIGIDRDALCGESTEFLLDEVYIQSLKKPFSAFDHKGVRGHVCVFGGNRSMMGAPMLTSLAAFRSGAGKVTAAIPESGFQSMNIFLPEAMTRSVGKDSVELIPDFAGFDSIAFGMGMGELSEELMFNFLSASESLPRVIDADGLNSLSKLKKIPFLGNQTVLTPHPKEFERLVGTSKSRTESIQKQKALSRETGAVILLKGAYSTITTADGRLYVSPFADAALGTAGSGDVLSGMIAALLGCGYSTEDAVSISVWEHATHGIAFRSMNGVFPLAEELTNEQ